MNGCIFLHRCPDKISGGLEVGNGIFWGGDFEAVKTMFQLNLIGNHEIKFFLGYSGWGTQQLNRELELNSWIVSNKFNPDLIFDDEEKFVERCGYKPGRSVCTYRQFPY